MSDEVVEKWLKSCKFAQVNGKRLRPLQHTLLKGTPLSVQKGQAEAYWFSDETGQNWILKKFHNGKNPDSKYLNSIASLLPKNDAFKAGTQRQILSACTLNRNPGCYYTAALANWLDGTVLMPKILGCDWSATADDIREGKLELQRGLRIQLALNLVNVIEILEKYNCCHRDISSGNVFIIIASGEIYLIDFDSMYHQNLAMPQATTCGSVGYISPYAWLSNNLDAKRTWCPYADRYALAIIIVEFLTLGKGSPLTAEGGMFEQEELRKRGGKGIDNIRMVLGNEWTQVLPLFDAVINSKDFASCPAPQDWQQVLNKTPEDSIRFPRIDELESIRPDYFGEILGKLRPKAPLYSAPSLSDMPSVSLNLSQTVAKPVSLPPDPWQYLEIIKRCMEFLSIMRKHLALIKRYLEFMPIIFRKYLELIKRYIEFLSIMFRRV